MAGVLEIGDLGHSIESMLTAVVDGHLTVSKSLFTVMQQAQDRLVHLLDQVKANQGLASADDIIAKVDEILGRSSLGKDANPEHSNQSEPAVAPTMPEEFPDESGSSVDETNLATELEALADALQFDDTSLATESSSPAETGAEIRDAGSVPYSTGLEQKDSFESAVIPPAHAESDNVVDLKTQRPYDAEKEKSALATDDEQAPLQDRRKAPRVQHEQVRVRADLLDNLVNFAGEVSI